MPAFAQDPNGRWVIKGIKHDMPGITIPARFSFSGNTVEFDITNDSQDIMTNWVTVQGEAGKLKITNMKDGQSTGDYDDVIRVYGFVMSDTGEDYVVTDEDFKVTPYMAPDSGDSGGGDVVPSGDTPTPDIQYRYVIGLAPEWTTVSLNPGGGSQSLYLVAYRSYKENGTGTTIYEELEIDKVLKSGTTIEYPFANKVNRGYTPNDIPEWRYTITYPSEAEEGSNAIYFVIKAHDPVSGQEFTGWTAQKYLKDIDAVWESKTSGIRDYTFPVTGGSADVWVLTDGLWEVTSYDTALTLSHTSGQSSTSGWSRPTEKDYKFTVTIGDNTGGAKRSGYIRLKQRESALYTSVSFKQNGE